MPEIVNQKVKMSTGECPARQGHRELIQLREVREQGGRGEGVGKQEQEGVAGVVLSSSDQESAQKAHIARQAKS